MIDIDRQIERELGSGKGIIRVFLDFKKHRDLSQNVSAEYVLNGIHGFWLWTMICYHTRLRQVSGLSTNQMWQNRKAFLYSAPDKLILIMHMAIHILECIIYNWLLQRFIICESICMGSSRSLLFQFQMSLDYFLPFIRSMRHIPPNALRNHQWWVNNNYNYFLVIY